jgi:hypothetical protein
MSDKKEQYFRDQPNGGQSFSVIDNGKEFSKVGQFSIEVEDHGNCGMSSSFIKINCLSIENLRCIRDVINKAMNNVS